MLLYILVLFCLVCHIYLQGGTTPLFYFLFCGILLFYVLCYLSLSFFCQRIWVEEHLYAVPVVPSATARHSIVYSAYYIIVEYSLCRRFVTTELVYL